MATAIQIPVAEYLQTTYRPDCEYIDGELRERNVGKWEHARLQLILGAWFFNHEAEWNVVSSTDQRIKVSAERVRVPDLVVLRPGLQPPVLAEAPLLVIEILSPGDTYAELEERCRDYQQMGVETMWIIDPQTRSGRMCVGREWLGAERLVAAGTAVYVELGDLFAGLSSAAGAGM